MIVETFAFVPSNYFVPAVVDAADPANPYSYTEVPVEYIEPFPETLIRPPCPNPEMTIYKPGDDTLEYWDYGDLDVGMPFFQVGWKEIAEEQVVEIMNAYNFAIQHTGSRAYFTIWLARYGYWWLTSGKFEPPTQDGFFGGLYRNFRLSFSSIGFHMNLSVTELEIYDPAQLTYGGNTKLYRTSQWPY